MHASRTKKEGVISGARPTTAVSATATAAPSSSGRPSPTVSLAVVERTQTKTSGNKGRRRPRQLGRMDDSVNVNIGAVQIARAISCPHDSYPVRLHNPFSTAPTAIAKPFAIQAISWNPAGSTDKLPVTDMIVFAFRDLLRAFIYYDPNYAAASYVYRCYFSASGQAPAQNFPLTSGVLTPLPIVFLSATSTYTPHGPTLYTGRSLGALQKFVWMETNATMQGSLMTSSTGTLTVYRWVDGQVSAGVQTNYVATTTITVNASSFPASGYYCFAITDPLITQVLISLQTTGGGSVFCHNPMPGIPALLPAVQAARIPAVSLMLTDEASELNNQGKVAIYQASQGLEWTDYVSFNNTKSGFSAVASSNGAHVEKLADGIYGYLKPTAEKDFDMVSYTESDVSDLIEDAWFELSPRSAFLVAYAQATSQYAGDLYATLGYHLEFESDNVALDVAAPTMDVHAVDAGLSLLARIPQFSCNPFHLNDIWGAITKPIGSVLDSYIGLGGRAKTIDEILKGISGSYKSSVPLAKALKKLLM